MEKKYDSKCGNFKFWLLRLKIKGANLHNKVNPVPPNVRKKKSTLAKKLKLEAPIIAGNFRLRQIP